MAHASEQQRLSVSREIGDRGIDRSFVAKNDTKGSESGTSTGVAVVAPSTSSTGATVLPPPRGSSTGAAAASPAASSTGPAGPAPVLSSTGVAAPAPVVIALSTPTGAGTCGTTV